MDSQKQRVKRARRVASRKKSVWAFVTIDGADIVCDDQPITPAQYQELLLTKNVITFEYVDFPDGVNYAK